VHELFLGICNRCGSTITGERPLPKYCIVLTETTTYHITAESEELAEHALYEHRYGIGGDAVEEQCTTDEELAIREIGPHGINPLMSD
jgi:hypothetical protein